MIDTKSPYPLSQLNQLRIDYHFHKDALDFYRKCLKRNTTTTAHGSDIQKLIEGESEYMIYLAGEIRRLVTESKKQSQKK